MITLRNGTEVHVSAMNAYPDGCLLMAELASVVLPALSDFPVMKNAMKAILSGAAEGEEERAAALAVLMEQLKTAMSDNEMSAGIFRGMATAIAGLCDRSRFERISRQLLGTLTVRHGGQMLPLLKASDVQLVAGSDLKLVLELLYVALKENAMSFFSGSGDTSAGASSARAQKA